MRERASSAKSAAGPGREARGAGGGHRPETSAGGEKETGRLEAFSDGVFAIAITLLVLDLKVPAPSSLNAVHGPLGTTGLLAALLHEWPMFLAYLTSFLTILVMWVNHHTLFTLIRRTDHRFLYLNGLLLLCVTFLPFPTSLVATYIQRSEAASAAALYSGTCFSIAIFYNLLWNHAAQGHRLLGGDVSPAAVREITREYRFGPIFYLVAFVLAFVSIEASLGTCLLLAVFFSFTGARGARGVAAG